MITYWPSPAKLNLFLYIIGKRKDGYHELQTLFQFLEYGDTIKIKLRFDGRLNLLTPINGIINEDNLIIRAARLLMKEAMRVRRLPVDIGADISIKKRLPIGSGLGGGSSNAATVLVALNYLWGCNLTNDELISLSLSIGSDVPIFINGYAAFAEGIGNIFTPVQLQEKWYLVIYPGISVSTALIFKDPELIRNSPKRSIKTLFECEFINVCENIVRKRFHKVNAAISWLTKYAPFRLTGTGSCIFAEFDTEFDAHQILKQIPEWLYGFIAKGVNLSPLKRIIASKS